jgi:hypothetical protein
MVDGAVHESTLVEITRLIAVLIWPVTILLCVLIQRNRISRFLSALVLLTESANRIKIGQVEVEKTVENSIDHEVAQAGAQADPRKTPEIPKRQALAAARVDTLISSLTDQPARDNLTQSVRLKMIDLAQEYESTRATMPSGKDRTGAMNAIVARMRTLAIAAKPSLKEFSENRTSPGTRLCAIVILQISPDRRYIEWLGQRFQEETPFMFYQTSVALLQAVHDIGLQNREQLSRVLTSSIGVIESYRKGEPDRNTLNVLKSAQSTLENTMPEVASN